MDRQIFLWTKFNRLNKNAREKEKPFSEQR